MNSLRTLSTASIFMAIVGCHQDNTPPPIAPQTQNQGVIPQAQLDALNKAKAVEGTLMEADQQRRGQVDQ